jgi:hypothetical protein
VIWYGFCKLCYAAGIARLCEGFVILKPGGAAVAVPPLDKFLAADIRKAARDVLDTRPPGSTARHAEHIAARTKRVRSLADTRPYYEGRSTDARFSRWVKVNVPDQRIFDTGSDPVTMTGGELYQLMFEAVERAYFWGADDVARPGWDADEIFGKRQERSAR